MRIYLADLCYLTDWDTNHPLPLNVGYVGAYLKARRPGDEIRLFKDPLHTGENRVLLGVIQILRDPFDQFVAVRAEGRRVHRTRQRLCACA